MNRSPLTLTCQQARAIDKLAIERCGITGLVLMENAGRGVVDTLLSLDPRLQDAPNRYVAILCGKGNNAGDGFVVARHLEIHGVDARVIMLASPEELSGDALANYKILCSTQIPIIDLSAVANVSVSLTAETADTAWIVDALLGTGARGEPREPVATAIRWMNAQTASRLAVDVPSGLDCDTGQPSESALRADHTCTFVATKRGFTTATAQEYLGHLHVVSIGIPPQLIDEFASASE